VKISYNAASPIKSLARFYGMRLRRLLKQEEGKINYISKRLSVFERCNRRGGAMKKVHGSRFKVHGKKRNKTDNGQRTSDNKQPSTGNLRALHRADNTVNNNSHSGVVP
jgi:hypothetical protein